MKRHEHIDSFQPGDLSSKEQGVTSMVTTVEVQHETSDTQAANKYMLQSRPHCPALSRSPHPCYQLLRRQADQMTCHPQSD